MEKEADGANALATILSGPRKRNQPSAQSFSGFTKPALTPARWGWRDVGQSAAVIYEKLAAAGGLRSEEAKARLNRLRLEHFLWEE